MDDEDLTPEQRARMKAVAEDFRASMETLGLGVTIQINDEPPVVVTEPPKPCS